MRASVREKPPLSTGKRVVFTAVMLLLPVLFFGLIEGGLRLAGYGGTYPLFVPVEGRPDYLYQNREVARRYFPTLANVPNSLTDFFEAQKGEATYRVFVQGGSSAAGFPFYYGGSFSRMLEQRLQQTFPDRRIEVVNTAMAAVNSYTLLDFVDEIAAQQPDAVLIYAGHNEYYGALGVGSAETISAFPFVTRAYLELAELRTVQALRALMARVAGWFAGPESGARPTATLMERVVGEQSIPYGSSLYEMGLRQFRSNLSALLGRYRARGVPVFIGTLASNEGDHAPFISGLAAETHAALWQSRVDEARAAAARGDLDAALSALEAAVALDSLGADALYLKGQVLEAQGRYDEARAAFLAAKDRDELRFRAPEAMNRIIREEAARHGAVVVDTQALLRQASPNGIIGHELMTEHLHPNPEGYFRIADAFYDALQAQHAVGAWTGPVDEAAARAEVLLTPVDSLVGIYRVRHLMNSWPFQPPGVVVPDTIHAASPVEEIARDLYLERIHWREANDRLVRYYEEQGDYHRALQATLAHVQEYPFVPGPYLAAGNLLVKQRRYDEALVYFEASNDLEESAPAQRMIGSILLQRGNRAEAIPRLERAVALAPEDATALYNLAGAYALDRQLDRARTTAQRLLQLRPDHADGRRLLASLPGGEEPIGKSQ